MFERNRGLMERSAWTTLGTALLLAALGPRANRRLRWAGMATAGCRVGILAFAVALVSFGIGWWLAGAPPFARPPTALGRSR